MLEPHPPHGNVHTWKDFFIHIATIAVGLLLAVGLEQTVEAVHRRHERQRLIASLDADNQTTIRDCAQAEQFLGTMLGWVREREQGMSAAAREHGPAASLHPFPAGSLDLPDYTVYRLAQAGGRLDLLSEEDAAAYGEVDLAYANLVKAYDQWNAATQQSIVARRSLEYGAMPGDPPYAHASPERLLAAYQGYLAQERGMVEVRLWYRQLHDAAAAVAAGERDLRTIKTEEHRRQDLP